MIRKHISLSKFLLIIMSVVLVFEATILNASNETMVDNELLSIIAEIDKLDQALYTIEKSENEESQLEFSDIASKQEENKIETIPEEGIVYYDSNETTEQDKLIANMAQRLKESAGLSNQDGSVVISGRCLSHHDKLILKGFVEGIREQLIKVTGLKFPSSAYRVSVMCAVPKSRKEDTKTARYKINIVPDAMPYRDATTIRLIIHHPNAMDSHEFAENIIRGYFGLYTHVLRESNYDGPSTELPNWFIKGLAKQIDFSSQQDDVNDILYLWSKALIPPVEKLTVDEPVMIQTNDALASALVGFWLDCGDTSARLKQLFTKLANGVKWSPKLYRETIRPNISSIELDKGFDYWILAQRFKVLKIGDSSEELAKRIVTHLTFMPENSDLSNKKKMFLLPVDLAKYKAEPWAKKIAEKNKRFLLATSSGRNDEFRAAASELASFYQAIIDGKATEPELQEIYYTAENKLFDAVVSEEK